MEQNTQVREAKRLLELKARDRSRVALRPRTRGYRLRSAPLENNMGLLVATVLEEDFPLATKMQRDFAVCDDELIFGRNEPALQHFHATLRTHLSNEEQDRS